ncbi:hypothetical protein TRVA0_015S02476 [Trichomonascus vanleenenianus]|uniref:uncharacterized protein n=1 Tax=Trichomonascus vanleenenianus TaxID=2268995 RepID=UPI003ECBA1AD
MSTDRLDPVAVTSGQVEDAIEKSWLRFLDESGTGVKMAQCLDLIGSVAEELNIQREVFVNDAARETCELFAAQVETISREEFGDLFGWLKKDLENKGLLKIGENPPKTDEKGSSPEDKDEVLSLASFDGSIGTAMESSTPVAPRRRTAAARRAAPFPLQTLDWNTGDGAKATGEIIGEAKAVPVTTAGRRGVWAWDMGFEDKENAAGSDTSMRSPRDARRLSEQEEQLRYFESRISQLEQERVDMSTELTKAKSELREHKQLTKEKDEQLRLIETSLHDVEQELRRKSISPEPEPVQVQPPENDQKLLGTIEELTEQVTLLEKEKEELENFAKQATEERDRLLQEIKQARVMADTSIASASSSPETANALQSLHLALQKQRRMLAHYTQGGPLQEDYAFVARWNAYAILGIVVALLVMSRLSRFASSTNWWDSTPVAIQAGKIDSWMRTKDDRPF